MRRPWLLALTLSCAGVRDYIPQAPTLSRKGIEDWLSQAAAPLEQEAPGAEAVPIPPFQLFAVHYERDIVLETEHPQWSMHEYAQVALGGRTVWVAKDSTVDGIQTVTADLPDLDSWLPEVPIPRRAGRVEVVDRSRGGRLDVTLRYRTPRDEKTTVHFSAEERPKLQKKRNSSTFNHSQQAASVLLDVRRKQMKAEAEVRYGDRKAKLRKVLKVVPVKALLEQVQAGIAAASMRIEPAPDGQSAQIERPFPGTPWPTRSSERWGWDGSHGSGRLRHEGDGVTHALMFEAGGLQGAELRLESLDEPALVLELSRPLPDPTRPFTGPVRRHFVLWVGAQAQGHGVIEARWDGSGTTFEVAPSKPYWFERRPVTSHVRRVDGAFRVESRILEPATGEPRPVAVEPFPGSGPSSASTKRPG